MLKALAFIGEIDAKHPLQVQMPEALPPGRGHILVLIPEEEEAGGAWMEGIVRE